MSGIPVAARGIGDSWKSWGQLESGDSWRRQEQLQSGQLKSGTAGGIRDGWSNHGQLEESGTAGAVMDSWKSQGQLEESGTTGGVRNSWRSQGQLEESGTAGGIMNSCSQGHLEGDLPWHHEPSAESLLAPPQCPMICWVGARPCPPFPVPVSDIPWRMSLLKQPPAFPPSQRFCQGEVFIIALNPLKS